MNVGWGGKQRLMHGSKILEKEGFLGKHSSILNVGDVQNFTYIASDVGPFYWSREKCEKKRHPVPTGNKKKHVYNKTELFNKITRISPNMRGSVKHLKAKKMQEIATSLSIPLEIEIDEMTPGWQGQPKGLLQVLWERGFLTLENYKSFSQRGSKDQYGNTDKDTSLVSLLSACKDFVNETSLLQDTLAKRGVHVMRTPKGHSEVAGEGIEYAWGNTKNNYRRLPMKDKSSKEKFMNSVRKVLSRDKLTNRLIRLFARKARAYTCAYYAFDNELLKDSAVMLGISGEDTLPHIEKLQKTFKTHRCALDFDRKFCTSTT